MNINTLSQTTTGYKSYNLAISLHENAMRKDKDGKTTYHASPIIRQSLDMESVANDMVTTGALTGYTVGQILEVWKVINGAVFDRVMNGAMVNCGLGTLYPRVTGSFTGLTDSYDTSRHSIDIGFHVSKETKALIAEIRPATVFVGNNVIPEVTAVVDFEPNSQGGGNTRRICHNYWTQHPC